MAWGWYVLLVFLGLLLLLLLSRARLKFSYDKEIELWVGIGLFHLKLLPLRRKIVRKQTKKGKIEKKSVPQPTQKIVLQSLLEYARFGLDTLGKTAKCLKVDDLMLHAVIGTEDAAQTALLYGAASTALSAFYPYMASRLKIKHQDLSLTADFAGKMDIKLRIAVSGMMLCLMFASLQILFAALKMRKGHKRQHKSGKAEQA